jgi:hypothetical protein
MDRDECRLHSGVPKGILQNFVLILSSKIPKTFRHATKHVQCRYQNSRFASSALHCRWTWSAGLYIIAGSAQAVLLSGSLITADVDMKDGGADVTRRASFVREVGTC